jgi:hypothetical protein
MIESPLLQRIIAERFQVWVLDVLKDRFGTVPRDVTRSLREVLDEKKLRQLNRLAAKCPDLEAFREALLSRARRRAVRRPSDHPEAER